MITYVTMIILLGIAALVVSLFDKFATPNYRPLRAIVFVLMGLSSIIPAVHLLITDGFEHMINYDSLHWTALMGLFYLLGAAIYAFRFPERCCPGRWDLFCHSHQVSNPCDGHPETNSFDISALSHFCHSCRLSSFARYYSHGYEKIGTGVLC